MKESELQKAIVKYIKHQYKDVIIIANPLSEVEFSSMPWKKKIKILQNAKAKGWESGTPDLILISDKGVLALELKAKRENPFRKYKNSYWIETTQDEKKQEHVMNQAYQLHRICKSGGIGLFVSDFERAKSVIDAWKNENLELGRYEFSYSYEKNCSIYL